LASLGKKLAIVPIEDKEKIKQKIDNDHPVLLGVKINPTGVEDLRTSKTQTSKTLLTERRLVYRMSSDLSA
jgi:hypothetical protein